MITDLDRLDSRVSRDFTVSRRTRLLIHRVLGMYRSDRRRIAAVRDVAREYDAYARHLRAECHLTPSVILRAAYAEKAARDIRKALA